MKKHFLALFCMATLAIYAQDKTDNLEWTAGRPDGHAPISVMGDHMHAKGEWMFSYRYMYMNMEDLKQGSDDATFQDALDQTMATPTRMPMNMHMLGAMYAPSDKVTLMAMANYISKEMDHITRMGGTFTTNASGFGDIKLSALYRFFNRNRNTFHGQLGLSIPTGSITESDVIPASAPNTVELPYPMQVGSGTLDPFLAFTYLVKSDAVSFGTQLKGVFRFGENSREFRYGNQYGINNWFALKACDWLSFSARLEGIIVGEIQGEDPNLNPLMVITADTNNSGGTFIESGLGANFYIPNGKLRNLRFGLELATPIYQNVNGIQLKTKEMLTVGTQYSF
jgi:hypothetical protein